MSEKQDAGDISLEILWKCEQNCIKDQDARNPQRKFEQIAWNLNGKSVLKWIPLLERDLLNFKSTPASAWRGSHDNTKKKINTLRKKIEIGWIIAGNWMEFFIIGAMGLLFNVNQFICRTANPVRCNYYLIACTKWTSNLVYIMILQ